jgi:hypothetical protein
MDRFIVVQVNLKTGDTDKSNIFSGELGADAAHSLAETWTDSAHRAFVVGLK